MILPSQRMEQIIQTILLQKTFDVKCDTIRDELTIIMSETITRQMNEILTTQQYRAMNGRVPTK